MVAPLNQWLNNSTGTGSSSITITIAPAASSQLVVGYFNEGSGTNTGFSVSDNGTGGSANVYTQGKFANTVTSSSVGSAVLATPTRVGAPTTVTITVAGATNFAGYAYVHEYAAGTFATTQPNQSGSGTSNAATVTGTNSGADTGTTPCVVYASISITSSVTETLATPSTYTNIQLSNNGATDNVGANSYRVNSVAGGTDSAIWSWTNSSNFVWCIASYTLASTGAPGGWAQFNSDHPGKGRNTTYFPTFKQGIPARQFSPNAIPSSPSVANFHPGPRPGPFEFPAFKQGFPAQQQSPQASPYPWQPTSFHPGKGPSAQLFPNFRQGIPTPSAVATIGTDVGAWTWAGVNVGFSTQLGATPGTWNWAGVTASLPALLSTDIGAWTWAGVTAGITTAGTPTLATDIGTWSWNGVSAGFSTQLGATPGTWAWAGVNVSFTTQLGASPGTWTWSGVNASLPSLIFASPGTWSWAGVNASLSTQVGASPGTWSWNGVSAGFSTQLGTDIGTWAWSGVSAGLINGTPTVACDIGTWAWAGLDSGIIVPGQLPPVTSVGGGGGGGGRELNALFRKRAETPEFPGRRTREILADMSFPVDEAVPTVAKPDEDDDLLLLL